MKLKSFAELIAMSKEQVDTTLAPMRAATAKAKANLLIAQQDEKIAAQEQQIQTVAVRKDIDFNTLAELIDDLELMTLRRERIADIVEQLFPPAV